MISDSYNLCQTVYITPRDVSDSSEIARRRQIRDEIWSRVAERKEGGEKECTEGNSVRHLLEGT